MQYPLHVEKKPTGVLIIEENKEYYVDSLFWSIVAVCLLAILIQFVIVNLTADYSTIPWWVYVVELTIFAYPIARHYLRKRNDGKYIFDPNRKQVRLNNQVYCAYNEIEALVFDIRRSDNSDNYVTHQYRLKICFKDSADWVFEIEYPVLGFVILNEISLATGIPCTFKENDSNLDKLEDTEYHYILINKTLYYQAYPSFTTFKNNPIERYEHDAD